MGGDLGGDCGLHGVARAAALLSPLPALELSYPIICLDLNCLKTPRWLAWPAWQFWSCCWAVRLHVRPSSPGPACPACRPCKLLCLSASTRRPNAKGGQQSRSRPLNPQEAGQPPQGCSSLPAICLLSTLLPCNAGARRLQEASVEAAVAQATGKPGRAANGTRAAAPQSPAPKPANSTGLVGQWAVDTA